MLGREGIENLSFYEMTMKVFKVADIVGGEITFSGQGKSRAGDVAVILTNIEPAKEPNVDFTWKMEIEIRKGPETRFIHLDLPHVISMSDSLDTPLFIGNYKLVFFRDQLFMSERVPKTPTEREEIALRVKKAVYDGASDLAGLRAAVANIEAAIEYGKSGPRRVAISEDVKLVVWTRDGGACVRCGSKQNLHFDHVIPIAKGGGNSEANIQILCQTCNLKKTDKISTM